MDIALAFGCALRFCEARGVDGVLAAIVGNQATCAGLVPSVLASSPLEVLSLRLVFTWGEALQAKVASEWAQRKHLVDLLISTECWLSLYADWTEHARLVANGVGGSCLDSPEFRAVPGAQVRIRMLEDRGTADAAGELLVAGPMVMPGYTDAVRNDAVLMEDGGASWYCTRDCVAPRGRGFVFGGRADDMVKVQCRESAEFLANPLKVAVDQADRFSWRVRMAFDTKLYGQERPDQFFALFQQNVRNLLVDPLQLIWPDAAA